MPFYFYTVLGTYTTLKEFTGEQKCIYLTILSHHLCYLHTCLVSIWCEMCFKYFCASIFLIKACFLKKD